MSPPSGTAQAATTSPQLSVPAVSKSSLISSVFKMSLSELVLAADMAGVSKVAQSMEPSPDTGASLTVAGVFCLRFRAVHVSACGSTWLSVSYVSYKCLCAMLCLSLCPCHGSELWLCFLFQKSVVSL